MSTTRMEQMASQRAEEMRRSMARCRKSGPREGIRKSVRQRAGWTLVEIGLRLARPSGNA
jgi:hypothetical protein